MADKPEPQPLPVRAPAESLVIPDRPGLRTLTFGSANSSGEIDVDRLTLYFQLEEEQKERDFQRQLELLDKQAEINEELEERRDKDRKLTHKLGVEKLQLYFKMFVSTAALALGTVFVLTNHENMGYFLLGGALSAVTSGVVGLMRASK